MYYQENDFELLYLINNNCAMAVEKMLDKYNALVYKQTFKHQSYLTPRGVEHQDLYQEGFIALHDSFYSFKNLVCVPFYSFTKVCIERKMWGYIRKFSSEASKLFYNSLSLDMTVTEDNNVYLHEMIGQDQEGISAFVLYRDDIESLLAKNKCLSEFELNVLVLKILGYTYQEVGDLLSCSAKKVDNTLQKTKRMLAMDLKA